MHHLQMLLLTHGELAVLHWAAWWQALSGGGHWQPTGAALQVRNMCC
jgi:hypothetical protein